MPADRQGPVSLCLVGDVFFGPDADRHIRSCGRDSLVRQLWKEMPPADLTVLNLEGPLTRRSRAETDKKYNLRSSPEAVDLLGPDKVAGLANNHILDFGEQGLKDTIEALSEGGIPHAGAGHDLETAQRPVTLEVAGLRVGVIFAADPRFQPAGKSTTGTCPANPAALGESVRGLKGEADFVVVSLHLGMEYTSVPTPYMISVAEASLEAGARVVQFHHSHRVSGMSRDERGVVLWGSGNYVFSGMRCERPRAYYGGAAWHLGIDGAEGRIVTCDLHPVTFDDLGYPVRPTSRVQRSIKNRINRWSRRIENRRRLGLWRGLSLLHPLYLRSSLPNYLFMLRREGAFSVFQAIKSTLAAQLRSRRP